MKDQLAIWNEAGCGWALWEFRGSFGVLDSGREDVKYEEFRGPKLYRKMLDLLRAGQTPDNRIPMQERLEKLNGFLQTQ